MLRRPALGLIVAALAASTSTIVTPATPAQAATVPAGFTDQLVAEFDDPTTVEWLPSEQLAVLEQSGTLHIGQPGGAFSVALTLDVCATSERGLLGLAPDPAFTSNGKLYVYYTRRAPSLPGGCANRLSSFTMSSVDPPVVDPASEAVLLDNISSVNGNHNGGAVEIGGDGFIYVGVGDAGRDPRGDSGSAGANNAAQDLSLLNGKVLRITTEGAPAPGNPLLGQPGVTACATRGNTATTPTTPCAEIYSWGLRNPYRMAFDRTQPDGTAFMINDVGQSTYEEVNEGGPGNFGWPDREGACPQGDTLPCPAPLGGQIDPVTAYPRSVGTYVTAGAFVPAGLAAWGIDGYAFADGGSGSIWNLPAFGSQPVNYAAPFATGADGITDMTFAFDAAGVSTLYYVAIGSGLHAITPPTTPATPTTGHFWVPESQWRAFDSEDRVPAGSVLAIDVDPYRFYSNVAFQDRPMVAAFVNITLADTAGPGFLRAWQPGTPRPATSTVNADRPGAFVANAAVVPVTDRKIVIEVSTSARVIVDYMGGFFRTPGPTADGRFVPVPPVRVADTRLPASATNEYADDGQTTIVDMDRGGFPADADADAVDAYVVSLTAIAQPDGPGGFVATAAGSTTYGAISNVNVTPGEVRANLAIVPADGSESIQLRHHNTNGVVVDVIGYFTGTESESSTTGQFRTIDPTRIVDSRVPTGFPRLADGGSSSVAAALPVAAAGLIQNVTATNTSAPGFLSTFAGTTPVPGVSNLNWTAAGQTRATLAITGLGPNDRVGYYALTSTDVVVDAIGLFTE